MRNAYQGEEEMEVQKVPERLELYRADSFGLPLSDGEILVILGCILAFGLILDAIQRLAS